MFAEILRRQPVIKMGADSDVTYYFLERVEITLKTKTESTTGIEDIVLPAQLYRKEKKVHVVLCKC